MAYWAIGGVRLLVLHVFQAPMHTGILLHTSLQAGTRDLSVEMSPASVQAERFRGHEGSAWPAGTKMPGVASYTGSGSGIRTRVIPRSLYEYVFNRPKRCPAVAGRGSARAWRVS